MTFTLIFYFKTKFSLLISIITQNLKAVTAFFSKVRYKAWALMSQWVRPRNCMRTARDWSNVFTEFELSVALCSRATKSDGTDRLRRSKWYAYLLRCYKLIGGQLAVITIRLQFDRTTSQRPTTRPDGFTAA